MRIISKSRGHFVGTHKDHRIEIEREPDGRFYIIVTDQRGCHAYNGWAPDEVTTMSATKREALRGACLLRARLSDTG